MSKLSGEMYRTFRLCIDSYDQGAMTGRFYQPGMDECRTFASLTQLLVRVEQLLDAAKFPQSFTAKRTFAPLADDPPEGPDIVGRPEDGAVATFVIRLMFRQHASWQGSVTWVEGKGEQAFRSVLELILLIDSALGGC